MTIKDYIKDKLYFIMTFFIVFIFMNGFLIFIKLDTSILFMIDISYVILFLTVILVEFSRRYHYYNDLLKSIGEMEEKYLIFDLIEEKHFLDSNFMINLMKQGNYAMSQEVSLYKEAQKEYKDYIELWVHEIKTPLSALKLMIENNNMTQSKKELNRLSYYIDQALYYARSSAVEKDYLIEPIHLEDISKQVVRELSNLFIEKNISVDLDFKGGTVYSDSKWLSFIIKQILLNSIQYSHVSSRVVLKSYDVEHAVVLEIIDHGVGIRQEDIPRIFDKGFTGAKGRVYNQATGMGLYLVKSLADSLHIGLSVGSDDTTTFKLTFPKSSSHFPN